MKCKLLILFTLINSINCLLNVYPKFKHEVIDGDPGVALYLTPLIEAGKIKEAQTKALVNFNGFKNLTSYSGYLTINKKFNSNSFFWFFPAFNNYPNAPVVLWLQGGPGATSLIGLFTENGPFEVKHKHGLKKRKYTWVENHSVLYIDNPVGTGYSFTDNDDGYAKNQTAIGEDLYNALIQFFTLFPELQKCEFYVTGESYAGKYVPAISYTIHKKNPTAKLKINFQGMAIGNGLSDPEHQLKYGDYLYQLGIIDTNALDQFHKYEQEGVDYIKKKDWKKAFILFDTLLNGDMINRNSYFKNVTGFTNYFNYLVSNDTSGSMDYMGKYIQRADVRAAIHVGNNSFNGENQVVEIHLMEDVMQSVAPWISEVLSHYRVLIYNGQLDIIVAYPLTINYLKQLQFSSADEYKKAERHLWLVGDELAGYSKTAGNLTEILVRNAGHMVPGDQPKWALDLITRFTHNKPFYRIK